MCINASYEVLESFQPPSWLATD